MRHRCSLWGGNKCATRMGYTTPQGQQWDHCACGCCRQFCNRPRGCDASLTPHDAVAPSLLAEPATGAAAGATRGFGVRAFGAVALVVGAAGVALLARPTWRARLLEGHAPYDKLLD
jgi:hypothetical protein